jgi:hypothetical protein
MVLIMTDFLVIAGIIFFFLAAAALVVVLDRMIENGRSATEDAAEEELP